MSHSELPPEPSRRSVLKAAMYVTPAVLTFQVNAAYASYGSSWTKDSSKKDKKDKKEKKEKKPTGRPF